jgi:predicted kinase
MQNVTHQPILLMLAGLPGTGKSTLAVALGARLGWPVLDKDVLNAVLLTAGFAQGQAGSLSYDLVLALARAFVVDQRKSIILDTAGRQPVILEQARLITREVAGQLKVIRLLAPLAVRQVRLGQRTAGRSQWTNDYASYNVAKKLLEFEFKEEIPRSRLRAVYGDGFHGAPLRCSSAGEAAFPSDRQDRHETASRQEEQAAGDSRRV